MPEVSVSYGEEARTVVAEEGSLLGEAIMVTGLPLEQPCAGRGTCGQCKVLVEGSLGPPDEAELKLLSPAEQAAGYRLACRARVQGDVSVTLSPIVVYSNKIFRASEEYRQEGVPLGLAIDLGTTTVAAFLTMLDSGRVCAGAAALNQQIVFGADVISRLAAAGRDKAHADRLSALALASIGQAIAALKLPPRIMTQVHKATIVGNCAMHHLLLRYPVSSLSMLPFQPYSAAAVRHAERLLDGVFPPQTEIALPPLIGGFVGSDALACLAYFGFDRAPGPMAAIDLGTNGEVMVTDGKRILVASTAAGPAFEGVNISCGTRAVDGAIVAARAQADGSFAFTTIGDVGAGFKPAPVGLTGSGLLSLVCELRRVGVIEPSGRFVADHPLFGSRLDEDARGVRRLRLTEQADGHPLYLTQQDVRELQKAKAAVRAAAEILMGELGLQPGDLQRLVLTGSFGSQVDVGAVVGLGMIPPVPLERVETEANGAGLGAALFLDDEEFACGERLATQARQVDLDLVPDFRRRFIGAMAMPGEP